jgi:glutaredoxin 3
VQFIAKNIREDQQALEELLKLGVRATPVTLIDGEMVVGFDRQKLEQLLGLTQGHTTADRTNGGDTVPDRKVTVIYDGE